MSKELDLPKYLSSYVPIILAGGSGSRFGSPVPKQFLTLGAASIVDLVVQTYLRTFPFEKIVLVLPEAQLDGFKSWAQRTYRDKDIRCIRGGATRQKSVYLGLRHATEHLGARSVIIQNAVAALTPHHTIRDCLKAHRTHGVVSAYYPIHETCMHRRGTFATAYLDRTSVVRIQSPQVFDAALLHYLHRSAMRERFIASNDVVLAARYGVKVFLVKTGFFNFKLTEADEMDCMAAFQKAGLREPSSSQGRMVKRRRR